MRVVVRDSRGQTVGGLKQDDFEIFDNGKPKPLVSFSEFRQDPNQSTKGHLPPHTGEALTSTNAPASQRSDTTLPTRFTIYLFDDMHLRLEELSRARDATDSQVQHLTSRSSEHIAVLSTSGKVRQPFTDDASYVHTALSKMTAQGRKLEAESSCPYMNYYMARRLETDSSAKAAVITEAVKCLVGGRRPNVECSGLPQGPQGGGDEEPRECDTARQVVEAEMKRQIVSGEMDGWTLLSALDGAIRQLSAVGGERRILLLSPGFTIEPHALAERIDRALHAGITVDVIDARGLWTDPVYDAERGRFSQKTTTFIRDSEQSRSNALAQIADGTGGTFYKNSNDLGEELDKAAELSDAYYMLAFSPGKLKNNGRFHEIRIKLTNGLNYHVAARSGYYEPGKREATELANAQTLAEVFLSREERHEIPLAITVFFGESDRGGAFKFGKPNADGVFETVASARIDVRPLHFRRDKDRWADTLTEVCGVFDQNGNFLTAVQNTTNLRLTKAEISNSTSGITVNSKFKLRRGFYVLRIVLQDSAGKMISARSVALQIG